MAEATADAERVLVAEASAGRRLVQVGFMREFDPDHQALLAEVTKGTVGRPMLVRCSHANPEPECLLGMHLSGRPTTCTPCGFSPNRRSAR